MSAPECRIVIYWTLVAADGEMLSCDLCRNSDGLHVRCVSDTGDVVFTELVASATEAMETATAWKQLYLGEHHWSEHRADDSPDIRSHPVKPRTVLEQRLDDRGTIRRARRAG